MRALVSVRVHAHDHTHVDIQGNPPTTTASPNPTARMTTNRLSREGLGWGFEHWVGQVVRGLKTKRAGLFFIYIYIYIL